MKYINISALKELSENDFQRVRPFPWNNLHRVLTDSGFKELVTTLPDISLFKKTFGMERAYGQKSHDRFELKYGDRLHISPEWKNFIKELSGSEYRREIARIFGTNRFSIRFQWQYSTKGCSVSPHCDSKNKLGSHIFYFNTLEDWKDEWGGQTLVLDDGGKLNCDSAPDISQFLRRIPTKTLGNYSLLFAQNDHSWHSVEELKSPPDSVRKIFTVIFEKKQSFYARIKQKVTALINFGR